MSAKQKPPNKPPITKPPTVHISVDTTTAHHIPSPLTLEKRPVSAMASLSHTQHRWLAYRDERTSSSSSDSGVVVCLSPPAPTTNFLGSSVNSLIGLSPPGLSPLNVNDSPFSTPTPSTGKSRFTFDHVPYTPSGSSTSPLALSTSSSNPNSAVSPGISALFAANLKTSGSPARSSATSPAIPIHQHQGHFTFGLQQQEQEQEEEPELEEELDSEHQEDEHTGTSAFGLAKNHQHEQLEDVLQRVRAKTHSKLERKQSVILHSTDRQRQLSVSVSDPPFNTIFGGQQLLLSQVYGPRTALTASLSSPLVPTVPKPSSSSSLGDDDEKNLQYYCHICKKDFKRPDILSRHVRRHTGEKPFGCDACGRYFSRSDHLRTHRRTHTDEKPYQCTICAYSARRRDVLTRHMSTRHQAKAGLSVFQKHRNARRCLSDGDALNRSSSSGISAATSATVRSRLLTSISRHQQDDDKVEMPKMEDIEDDVIVDDL